LSFSTRLVKESQHGLRFGSQRVLLAERTRFFEGLAFPPQQKEAASVLGTGSWSERGIGRGPGKLDGRALKQAPLCESDTEAEPGGGRVRTQRERIAEEALGFLRPASLQQEESQERLRIREAGIALYGRPERLLRFERAGSPHQRDGVPERIASILRGQRSLGAK
jgi:hypothetical protein